MPEKEIEPLFNTPEYRCPHCDAVLDSVKCIQTLSIRDTFLAYQGDDRVMHRKTPEFLATVMAEYEHRGLPGVMQRFRTGERNARRWLAEARNGDVE